MKQNLPCVIFFSNYIFLKTFISCKNIICCNSDTVLTFVQLSAGRTGSKNLQSILNKWYISPTSDIIGSPCRVFKYIKLYQYNTKFLSLFWESTDKDCFNFSVITWLTYKHAWLIVFVNLCLTGWERMRKTCCLPCYCGIVALSWLTFNFPSLEKKHLTFDKRYLVPL